jgi:hypothetical protein
VSVSGGAPRPRVAQAASPTIAATAAADMASWIRAAAFKGVLRAAKLATERPAVKKKPSHRWEGFPTQAWALGA